MSEADYPIDDEQPLCPDCGEELLEINVEAFELFDTLLCSNCLEARCEKENCQ